MFTISYYSNVKPYTCHSLNEFDDFISLVFDFACGIVATHRHITHIIRKSGVRQPYEHRYSRRKKKIYSTHTSQQSTSTLAHHSILAFSLSSAL